MIVAGFADRAALQRALVQLAARHIATETYTPVPLYQAGPDATASPLPSLMLAAFVLASLGFFGLQLYADTWGYRINIGGRPDNAWPAFIVNAFEAGVLCAMATGVLGYFALNHMPRLYEPVDHAATLRAASRDGWFVSIEGDHPGSLACLADAITVERV